MSSEKPTTFILHAQQLRDKIVYLYVKHSEDDTINIMDDLFLKDVVRDRKQTQVDTEIEEEQLEMPSNLDIHGCLQNVERKTTEESAQRRNRLPPVMTNTSTFWMTYLDIARDRKGTQVDNQMEDEF